VTKNFRFSDPETGDVSATNSLPRREPYPTSGGEKEESLEQSWGARPPIFLGGRLQIRKKELAHFLSYPQAGLVVLLFWL
jgi:hypothetical protein